MPSTFRLLKNNCPICSGDRPDCRANTDTNLIHCRHDATVAPGYKFVGEDKHGFFMWVVDDGHHRSTEELERIKLERAAQKQRRLFFEQQRLSQLLGESERDQEISRLLAQLGLKEPHKADLQGRGLDDEQIRNGQFRSLSQWQRLETEVSHRLAGVNITGRGLTNFDSGYLCPIWNPLGQIIGWQLRLDDTLDGGKYRWPTSNSKKRPNGPTSHLPNGELPITCCRPTGQLTERAIGLVEGILKPYITAQLKGQIVLGAAGGNFASSPETLKAYLDALEAKLGTKQCILYADAGAIANRQVMKQYRRTHALLKNWGYEMQIGWWGQVNKEDLDIDELLAAGRDHEINIISFAQFETLVHNPLWIFDSLKLFFKRIIKRIRPKRGFATQTTCPPPQLGSIIDYKPGKLPAPDKQTNPPVIQFKKGQRLQVIQELVMLGWKHILDKSAPGLGKSHDAGASIPSAFRVTQRLWYFSDTHRNPTTATIESNYTDMPVRNHGMVVDSSRQTSLGNPHIRWPQPEEQPTTAGNCFKSEIFLKLHHKNLDVEGANNPICGSCHMINTCKHFSGLGSGFLHERHLAFQSSRIRLSLESAPDPADTPLNEDGAFWDEAMKIIKPVKVVQASLSDFDQMLAAIENILPELRQSLRILRPLLEGEVKQEQKTYYGWNDLALRSILPDVPDNIEEIIALVKQTVQPDLQEYFKSPDFIPSHKNLNNLTRKRVNRIFRTETYSSSSKAIDALPVNWLVPFLSVWARRLPGALRINNGAFRITIHNPRPSEIASATKWNCYLDATAVPEYLALYLNLNKSEIVTIEQELPAFQNLKIIQVNGFGLAGKNRSLSCNSRIAVLKAELRRTHNDDITILDWMKSSNRDGWWFNHTRGSNEFQQADAIASFGIPYQNIGATYDEFCTLTGQTVVEDAVEFRAFVQWQTESEIIQSVGRLRSLHRPNEQLTYYFCADYELSFLKTFFPGANIEQIEAFQLHPSAGTLTQISRWAILEAFSQVVDTGTDPLKIPIKDLAKVAGVTVGRVSQIARIFGGFKQFKKSLVRLDQLFNRDTKLFDPSSLSDEEIWAIENYLPLILELDYIETIAPVGTHKEYLAIFTTHPVLVLAKLIHLMLFLLPLEIQVELKLELGGSG